MSYDIELYPRTASLDPRNQRSIEVWRGTPSVDRATQSPDRLERLIELVIEAISSASESEPHEHRGQAGIEITCDEFQILLSPDGGEMSVSSDDEIPEWVHGLIDELTAAAGWVAYDPQAGRVLAGLELVCADCGSRTAPDLDECGACGASVANATLA